MASFLNRHRMRIGVASLGMVLSISACGCFTVTGRSASMDSISRMPWFNLELKPRKKATDESYHREVRSDQGVKSRIDTLGLFRANGNETAVGLASGVLPKSSTALPTTEKKSDSTGQAVELDFR